MPPGVSVIVNRTTLVQPDGTAISLAAIKPFALGGYQTRDGFLIHGYGNGVDSFPSLWLVTQTGKITALIENAEGPVAVGPDGRTVAWRAGGRVNVGHVGGTSVVINVSTPVPGRELPVSVGVDSVVLGYTDTGGGIGHWDPWFPKLGDYKSTQDRTTSALAVYPQGLPNGNYMGLVSEATGSKSLCVAEMNPKNNLQPATGRYACGLGIQHDRLGAVSPDGRYLAVASATASGDSAVDVLDLTTVFTTPAKVVRWGALGVGAWEDGAAMLVVGPGNELMRYRISSGVLEVVARPGVKAGDDIALLRRLG